MTDVTGSPSLDADTVERAIAVYFEGMEAMDPSNWVTQFAPGALIYDPVGNPPTRAQEDAPQFFGMLKQFFQQLTITRNHTFVVGNSAAVKWTMQVVAKNQRTATAEGISIFDLDESGRICTVSAYWNDAQLMGQLR